MVVGALVGRDLADRDTMENQEKLCSFAACTKTRGIQESATVLDNRRRLEDTVSLAFAGGKR